MRTLNVIKLFINKTIELLMNFTDSHYQIRREKLLTIVELEREKGNCISELEQQEKNDSNRDIKDVFLILLELKDNFDLTSSYTDRLLKEKPQEYSKQHKERSITSIHKLEILITFRFSDRNENVYKIKGFINQFWGNQNNLLALNYFTYYNEYNLNLEKVIKIASELSKEINILRLYFVSVSNKINRMEHFSYKLSDN